PRDFPAIAVVDGDHRGTQWLLNLEVMTLGRGDECEIVLPLRQISRQHVRFRRLDDYYQVEDMASKNGTWLNGTRLEGSARLNPGDEITLARSVTLKFVGAGNTITLTGNLPPIIATSASTRLRVDTEARRIFVLGQEIDPPLSLPQYRLLELLYLNMTRVCPRDEVVGIVWPEAVGEGVSEQAIDALVRRLRDRLMEYDQEHQYIVTVRGHGFRLDNPAL
nr:FHA domain-containing protein [Anaerolineae bacterium]